MAQMPNGKPRSVLDPAGDQYDEVFRQQRLDRQRKAAAGGSLQSSINAALDAEFSSPIQSRLKFSDRRLDRTSKIGHQYYREIDNGQANVLVPIEDPSVSPTELADRRRAVDRVIFMANNPLAGGAYGLAAMANGSPQTRDRALLAGSVLDAAMFGAAPLGAQSRPVSPPRARVVSPAWPRPNVRDKGTNADGQAMGMDMTVTADIIGTGTKANRRIKPPGWSGNGWDFNEARAHLQAKDLGGQGNRPNLMTLTQNPTNTPHMRDFEQEAVRRARSGDVFDYSVTPFYTEGVLPPSSVLMTMFGGRRAPAVRIIPNPAGRRK